MAAAIYIRNIEYRNSRNISEDDVVVIIQDNYCSQLHWKLVVVTRVFLGDDQLVHVADVRTPNGTLRRPIHKLCLLPIAND